jgi:hypothetical protein
LIHFIKSFSGAMENDCLTTEILQIKEFQSDHCT